MDIKLIKIFKIVVSNKPFTSLSLGDHGKPHAYRVFLLANSLTNLISKRVDKVIIIISSLLHDCGRTNNISDPNHSIKSAKIALKFIKKHNIRCNKKLLEECIIRHCPPKDYKNDNPSLESKIIGDADKLDRFRLTKRGASFNQNLLELPESKLLIDMAKKINS